MPPEQATSSSTFPSRSCSPSVHHHHSGIEKQHVIPVCLAVIVVGDEVRKQFQPAPGSNAESSHGTIRHHGQMFAGLAADTQGEREDMEIRILHMSTGATRTEQKKPRKGITNNSLYYARGHIHNGSLCRLRLRQAPTSLQHLI